VSVFTRKKRCLSPAGTIEERKRERRATHRMSRQTKYDDDGDNSVSLKVFLYPVLI
jgi:hypothetical protein